MPEAAGEELALLVGRDRGAPVEPVPERAHARFAELPPALHSGNPRYRDLQGGCVDLEHFGPLGPVQLASMGVGSDEGGFGFELQGIEEGHGVLA